MKSEKEILHQKLKDIQSEIDDIKLMNNLDIDGLKKLIKERSSIEFKLSIMDKTFNY